MQTVLTGAEIGIFGRAPELATYFNCSPFISPACDSFADRISEPLAKTTGGPPSHQDIKASVHRGKISGYNMKSTSDI